MFTYHQLVNSSFTIGASEVVLSTGELALTTGVTVSGAQVIGAVGGLTSISVLMTSGISRDGYQISVHNGDHNPLHFNIEGPGIKGLLE